MTDVLALREIVEELVEAGVTDVIVCPGSRSTPLALATRAHPGLTRPRPARRAIGRVLRARPGPGIASPGRRRGDVGDRSGEPAAVGRRGVARPGPARPADGRSSARAARPWCAADDRPGAHLRRPCPLVRRAAVARRGARDAPARPLVVGRAVATARGRPAGPVHLNLGFREPLVPSAALGPLDGPVAASEPDGAAGEPTATSRRSPMSSTDGPSWPRRTWRRLAARLASVERGLIVAGPQDDPGSSGRPGAPGRGDRVSDRRRSAVAASAAGHTTGRSSSATPTISSGPGRGATTHLPELVIRFGATPTSKPLLTLLGDVVPAPDRRRRRRWLERPGDPPDDVRPRGRRPPRPARWRRPSTRRPGRPRRPPSAGRHGRRAGSTPIERPTRRSSAGWPSVEARGEPFEGLPFAVLGGLAARTARSCGPATACRSATSTTGCPASARAIRPLSNRGANGIDGVVSTALGAAAADVGPVVLVVGDLSFLHDLNALVAARLHGLSATIVLIDNDGGGIFSFLPQATTDAPEVGLPDHYEELFGTPHGIDVGPIVTALGGGVPTGRHRLDCARRWPTRSADRASGSSRFAPTAPGTSSSIARRPPRSPRPWRACERHRRRRPALGGPDPRRRGAAAAPPRLHGPRDELGRARDRASPGASA